MVTREEIIKAVDVLSKVTFKNDDGVDVKLSNATINIKLADFKIREAFLNACESISQENEKYIPDTVSTIYNLIVEEEAAKEDTKLTDATEKVNEVVIPIVEKKKEKKPKEKGEKSKKDGSPSRKQQIYELWKINNKITFEEINTKIPGLAKGTIQSWKGSWARGKGLPSEAKVS